MKFKSLSWVIITSFLFSISVETSFASRLEQRLERRADKTATVLQNMDSGGKRAAPKDLLSRATCIAVFPSVRTISGLWPVSLTTGGGLVSCRTGKGWSKPLYMRLSSLGLGLSIGIRWVSVGLLFMDENAPEQLVKAELNLGSDIGIYVGPLGNTLTSELDYRLKSGVYSYITDSKGLYLAFTGAGAWIASQHEPNRVVHGLSSHTRVEDSLRILNTPYEDEPLARGFIEELEIMAGR